MKTIIKSINFNMYIFRKILDYSYSEKFFMNKSTIVYYRNC